MASQECKSTGWLCVHTSPMAEAEETAAARTTKVLNFIVVYSDRQEIWCEEEKKILNSLCP